MGAHIEQFLQSYYNICKDHQIETQECIINQLKSAYQNSEGNGYVLQLSTNTLTSKSCAVLAKLLRNDVAFKEIKMCDCMLPEDGIKTLCHGLSQNVACSILDLKGNNIRGLEVEYVGRMLRQNTNITSLCLEWNSLGQIGTSFAVFCEGIASNNILKTLDLRNNQLNHDCAKELSQALKRNTALKVLDLRWNSIGLIGGRALQECLENNKTLITIELTGNNTPTDIIRAIECAVNHNSQQNILNSRYQDRTDVLAKELQTVTTQRNMEVMDLLEKVDRQDMQLRNVHHKSAMRIKQLQTALQDRHTKYNDINMKLSLADSELALSETKVTDLNLILKRVKEDHEKGIKQLQMELKHERENKSIMEAKLNKQIMEANNKLIQTENKLDENERHALRLQDKNYELKEKILELQAQVNLNKSQYQELVLIEKQKTKECYKDAEQIKQKEIERNRKEIDEVECLWKERLQKHEQQRINCEEEITKLRNLITAEKLQSEEAMQAFKQRLKTNEEQRYMMLEEKYHLAQTCKDELSLQVATLSTTNNELQLKKKNFVLEVETHKRKIDELNQELAGKNMETLEEVGKVKLEMSQRIKKLEQSRLEQSDLYDKIANLEQQLADLSSKYRHNLESKESEISALQERLRLQELSVAQKNADEAQKIHTLQAALHAYINPSPYRFQNNADSNTK